jgi:hypothetical protein
MRGGALSFWAKDEPACAALLSPLPQAVEGFAGMKDSGRIVGNYRSGALVSHETSDRWKHSSRSAAFYPR